jgi:serine/threonine protein kinase
MSESILLNNRYRLEEPLGSGGMAMVYRGHDLMLERTVAIKILRKDYSNDPEFRERFHLEAKAAANLSHPNIVTVHDFGLNIDQLFIVMEYVPGTDLKTILKKRGRISIPEAIELISQACAGIGYAHRAGLVHCDIKPQNMLVTPEKRLKVVDFGIARALSAISPDERMDIVWGSPQYFSPEQAAGGAPSPASDVYSLGVIFFEMLTGKLPFAAQTAEELARQHRETLPPSPRKFNPSIPIPLEQIILKILAKEPSSRYRTADQLGRVLSSYSQQSRPPAAVNPPVREAAPEETKVSRGGIRTEPHPYRSLPPTRNANEIPLPIIISPVQKTDTFDWMTWGLAFLALLLIGGLIPFWMWVYLTIKPPI